MKRRLLSIFILVSWLIAFLPASATAASISSGLAATGAVSFSPWVTIPSNNTPPARYAHTAVWTGNQMCVWGGEYQNGVNMHGLSNGGCFNPLTRTWTPISLLNPPEARFHHTAIWTGTLMCVWGGESQDYHSTTLGTGGCYDPASAENPDLIAWKEITTTGSPAASLYHTVVWTGTQMCVWGGMNNMGHPSNEGSCYNPATDTWTAISTTNAPSPRYAHTAAWTGNQMCVWGGTDGVNPLNDGACYTPGNPGAWTAIVASGAPSARKNAAGVWTGSQICIWGGLDTASAPLNTGGCYTPSATSTPGIWTDISTTNAPAARVTSAAWTGTQMCVWGGLGTGDTPLNSGGCYIPGTPGVWTTIASTNAPTARSQQTIVWVTDHLCVWGGSNTASLDSGGCYDLTANTWSSITSDSSPEAGLDVPAVWASGQMCIWNGGSGSCNNPVTGKWTPISGIGAPEDRGEHSVVSTGSLMCVWGGKSSKGGTHELNTGGCYNPVSDTWKSFTTLNAPEPSAVSTAVWTGSQMCVWGGEGRFGFVNTGGCYSPTEDKWISITTTNAPEARVFHSAIWTGAQMCIWGGHMDFAQLNSGGCYDPVTDDWTDTLLTDAPQARALHLAVWTGSQMCIWGGGDSDVSEYAFANGGCYDPVTHLWETINTTGAPSGRYSETMIWTGRQMCVWGGQNDNVDDDYHITNTGSCYDPGSKTWEAMPTNGGPAARSRHSAVWTGTSMGIWGGKTFDHYFTDAAYYTPMYQIFLPAVQRP